MPCVSVKFWAWTVSIAVHLAMLAVFGFVKISQANARPSQDLVPTANISHVNKLLQADFVIPKPKVITESRVIASSKGKIPTDNTRAVPAQQIFEISKPAADSSLIFDKPSQPGALTSQTIQITQNKTEFFGAATDQRKICYVVDSSGSMQGIFSQVKKELKDSIVALEPDQYFSIIFFGSNKLFQFGQSRPLRATSETKAAAVDFIDSIRPTGQTNALDAIEKALQIRDSGGTAPAVIYFLTDGFELTPKDVRRLPTLIANLRRQFAPNTKINTICFWPQDNDRGILEVIARESSGQAVFIDKSE